MSVAHIQKALQEQGLDGWLFYDFRGSDPLSYVILGMPRDVFRSRRWFYYVPATGKPVRIVHAIEPGALDMLDGEKKIYLPWQQLHDHLRETLRGSRRIAMQYSPNNNIPYVARVDAGTLELIRSLGPEVVTSADLVSLFAATMDPAQERSHHEAADALGNTVLDAFREIGRRAAAGKPANEYEIQQFILEQFERRGVVADHAPIVGADAHSADPHFETSNENPTLLKPGTWVLIDAWCKQKHPGAIYADITWTGWVGDQVPAEIEQVFRVVRDARDAAVNFVADACKQGRDVRGCDVDDACRAVIQRAGLGEYFIHRTGHSLHEAVHANGANIDNLESRDERLLLPRTCFTVEPGVYLPGRFGVRSEINVFMDGRQPVVTGIPRQVDPILAR